MDSIGRTAPFPVDTNEEEMAGCPAPDPPPGSSPRRVLVIEDAPLQREILAYILRRAGFRVTDAGEGHEGLRRLREGCVDLVLTDLHLPDLSGWEVARAVRLLRPDLPVVLVTGSPDAMSSPPDLRALVRAILPKPLNFDQLLDLVSHLTAPCRTEPFRWEGEQGTGRMQRRIEAERGVVGWDRIASEGLQGKP